MEQDRFIKEQHGLLTKSIKGFVEILQRISVFRNVSRILKVDPVPGSIHDMESTGLTESLLDRETIEATGLAILGGVIGAAEEITLKKLLFRSTRGQAMLHTFPIDIQE